MFARRKAESTADSRLAVQVKMIMDVMKIPMLRDLL